MDKAMLDALVEGYEDLIPTLSLPDENDPMYLLRRSAARLR
jgi:hypothetical protein